MFLVPGDGGVNMGGLPGGGGEESIYSNAYLMLTPELQPISPATDLPESMRIFEEHKRVRSFEFKAGVVT